MVGTVRSVSCLLFFYSWCHPCGAICKSGARGRRVLWSLRHCFQIFLDDCDEMMNGGLVTSWVTVRWLCMTDKPHWSVTWEQTAACKQLQDGVVVAGDQITNELLLRNVFGAFALCSNQYTVAVYNSAFPANNEPVVRPTCNYPAPGKAAHVTASGQPPVCPASARGSCHVTCDVTYYVRCSSAGARSFRALSFLYTNSWAASVAFCRQTLYAYTGWPTKVCPYWNRVISY